MAKVVVRSRGPNYELSHPWGMYMPIYPGYVRPSNERITGTDAGTSAVMSTRPSPTPQISTQMQVADSSHSGAAAVGDLALIASSAPASWAPIPKKKWQLIERATWNAAKPGIRSARSF